MSLTEHVDWFRTVAASCRRVERLFLDQGGVGGVVLGGSGERKTEEGSLGARVCVCEPACTFKEYCSLLKEIPPLFILNVAATAACTCSSCSRTPPPPAPSPPPPPSCLFLPPPPPSPSRLGVQMSALSPFICPEPGATSARPLFTSAAFLPSFTQIPPLHPPLLHLRNP